MVLYPKILRFVYTLLYTVALPLLLLRLLVKSRGNAAYRRGWLQRLGWGPQLSRDSIWVHAVSVGETIAVVPLIKALHVRYPNYQIIVTTTTPTGREQVLTKLSECALHSYTPYDLPWCIKRFLRRARVRCMIVMETELWPNMLQVCRQQQFPMMLANARLSAKSAHSYRLVASLVREMLTAFTVIAAQSAADGERFIGLGLPREKLLVAGNIKFDLQPDAELCHQAQALRHRWGSEQRPTWIAASTHEGEEAVLLTAAKHVVQQVPNALLLIVPRHPERFEKVKLLCEKQGFSVVQRSQQQVPDAHTQIMLGDTMGELMLMYAVSDVAFVGGSLVPVGGHNFIEPGILSLPLLSGEHLHNFTVISELLLANQALQLVMTPQAIAAAVVPLLNDVTQRNKQGKRAFDTLSAHSGALQRHLAWIEQQLN